MATTTAISNSFKKELLDGTHSFFASGGDTFKMSIHTDSATLNASTTAYSTTGEVSGTGYAAGGAALTNVNPSLTSGVGVTDFNDVSWSNVTFSGATGVNIYNSTDSNKSVSTNSLGGTQTVTGGTFTIQFPVADATNAIIRIA